MPAAVSIGDGRGRNASCSDDVDEERDGVSSFSDDDDDDDDEWVEVEEDKKLGKRGRVMLFKVIIPYRRQSVRCCCQLTLTLLGIVRNLYCRRDKKE